MDLILIRFTELFRAQSMHSNGFVMINQQLLGRVKLLRKLSTKNNGLTDAQA